MSKSLDCSKTGWRKHIGGNNRTMPMPTPPSKINFVIFWASEPKSLIWGQEDVTPEGLFTDNHSSKLLRLTKALLQISEKKPIHIPDQNTEKKKSIMANLGEEFHCSTVGILTFWNDRKHIYHVSANVVQYFTMREPKSLHGLYSVIIPLYPLGDQTA